GLACCTVQLQAGPGRKLQEPVHSVVAWLRGAAAAVGCAPGGPGGRAAGQRNTDAGRALLCPARHRGEGCRLPVADPGHRAAGVACSVIGADPQRCVGGACPRPPVELAAGVLNGMDSAITARRARVAAADNGRSPTNLGDALNQPQPGRTPDLSVSAALGRRVARRLPLFLALQAALVAPFALASPAGQAEEPATTLDQVVVTATRRASDALVVPAAVDVVSGEDIRLAQPGINLSESVQRIPGVVARDRQNYAQDQQISIRGFGARATFGVRGIRMFSDGIPATMPDGQGQVSHFLFDAADRVEVLRGPFSALYGNASGGVISLFTADAPVDPLLRAGYVAGSDGLRRAAASHHAPWGANDRGGFLFGLVDLEPDGCRDHGAATRRQGQVVLKGELRGAGGRYALLATVIGLKARDPQGLSRDQLDGDRRAASAGALQFDTRKTVRQDQVGLNLEQPLGGGHELGFTAYAGRRETTQMLAIPVFVQQRPLHGGGAIDLDRDYYGGALRWRWEGAWLDRPFSLTAGHAHEVSDERRLGFENFIGDTVGVVGALRRDEDNVVTGRDVYVQA